MVQKKLLAGKTHSVVLSPVRTPTWWFRHYMHDPPKTSIVFRYQNENDAPSFLIRLNFNITSSSTTARWCPMRTEMSGAEHGEGYWENWIHFLQNPLTLGSSFICLVEDVKLSWNVEETGKSQRNAWRAMRKFSKPMRNKENRALKPESTFRIKPKKELFVWDDIQRFFKLKFLRS